MRRKPIGSEWRILAWNKGGHKRVDIHSLDYGPHHPSTVDGTVIQFGTVFDELLLKLGDEWIHVEQMDKDTWFVGLGDEKRMVTVGRDGKIKVGDMYK